MQERMTAVDQGVRQLTRWEIDPAHSEVGFAARHLMISTVRGRFAGVSGTIYFDESNPTAGLVEVEIDAATIDTRNEQRDAHLRSPDFLDVETYPKITFVSRTVEQVSDTHFKITGDLTIRDVTREVVLDAMLEGTHPDPWGTTRIAFTANTQINRHDFGLNWNVAIESGGVLVGDMVKISLDIQAVRAA